MTRRRSRRSDDLSNIDVRPIAEAFSKMDRRTQTIVIVVAVVALLAAGVFYFVHLRQESQQREREAQRRQQQSQTQPTTGQTAPPPTTTSRRPPRKPSAGPTANVPPPSPADVAENLLLGNPSNATTDTANRDNYLLVKPYYTLSFNDTKGTPNWVSWRVTAADLGEAPRKLEFDPDDALPGDFKHIVHKDYSNSGFDRGHICPHSDRAANEAMSYATFVMSNIIPQSPNVNQRAWRELEEYGRDLVRKQVVRLYIVSGPNGRGGRGSKGPAETVARGRVVVPAECWKIIVVVPETGAPGDVSAITAANRVITVIMPNDNDLVTNDNWTPFRTSPAEVERRTGYKFFERLPAEVADALRKKVDDVYVPPPKAHKFTEN